MHIIIKKRNGAKYHIAVTDYGLAVVDQTNSYPVCLTGPLSYTCELYNLPKYVKTWLYEIARLQDWYHEKA